MMKSFKEYLTEQEETKFQEELNEDLLTAAGMVLGYSSAGLLVAWGGSLIVKGYMSLAQKAIAGITKFWSKMFDGKKAQSSEVTNLVRDLKQENTIKIEIEKSKTASNEYTEKFAKVYAAIEDKDVDKAIEELKNSGVKQNPSVHRVLVSEIVKIFGEPPIHYGNTGNECYLFIKRFLGIKVAQSTAAVVREALKKHGSELVQDEEESLNNEDK